jgi:hypothetical protein
MQEWMDGWMGRWMVGGWMDEWMMNECTLYSNIGIIESVQLKILRLIFA